MLENTLFETHFNIIPFPIYVVDTKTYELLFSNHSFNALFGDHGGAVCYKALYERDEPCIECRIADLVDQGNLPNGETRVFERFNDMDDNWYQLQEKSMSWPDGRTVKYSIAVDISELKRTQNKLAEAHAELALKSKDLERLASHDKLTGILNRLKLDELFETEVQRSRRYERPLSVILIDIDKFKAVNDTHGHQAGDEVLKAFAALLGDNLRANDIFGRWGGEEFLVLCPESGMDKVLTMAEKLRALVEGHDFPVVGGVTASFGVAELTNGEAVTDVMHRADEALYRAKEKGRNRVESGGS